METKLGKLEQRFLMTDLRHYLISLVIIFTVQVIYLRDITTIIVWIPFFITGLLAFHIGAYLIIFRKEDIRRKRLWREKYAPPESFDRSALTGKISWSAIFSVVFVVGSFTSAIGAAFSYTYYYFN